MIPWRRPEPSPRTLAHPPVLLALSRGGGETPIQIIATRLTISSAVPLWMNASGPLSCTAASQSTLAAGTIPPVGATGHTPPPNHPSQSVSPTGRGSDVSDAVAYNVACKTVRLRYQCFRGRLTDMQERDPAENSAGRCSDWPVTTTAS